MSMPRVLSALPMGAALSIAGLVALSGCDERPYPSSSNTAPPAAAPPADLMGAPSGASPYVAPSPPPPAYAPPPTAYAPPPAPSYETGAVVAMAPIPNPGAPGSDEYYGGRRRRVHGHYETSGPVIGSQAVSPYGEGHPAPGRSSTYSYPSAAPKTPIYPPTVTARAPFSAHAAPPAVNPQNADKARRFRESQVG